MRIEYESKVSFANHRRTYSDHRCPFGEVGLLEGGINYELIDAQIYNNGTFHFSVSLSILQFPK